MRGIYVTEQLPEMVAIFDNGQLLEQLAIWLLVGLPEMRFVINELGWVAY